VSASQTTSRRVHEARFTRRDKIKMLIIIVIYWLSLYVPCQCWTEVSFAHNNNISETLETPFPQAGDVCRKIFSLYIIITPMRGSSCAGAGYARYVLTSSIHISQTPPITYYIDNTAAHIVLDKIFILITTLITS